MMGKRIIVSMAFIMVYLMFVPSSVVGKDNFIFEPYGDGPIEVRLYSSYFCPPCQVLEPKIEPILLDLVEKKAIRLLFVDIPAGQEARLYVHYYFFALKVENSLERALSVRNILFVAAKRGDAVTEDALEALFEEHAVAYEKFDVESFHPRLNELISGDGIRSTPTMVIIGDGERKKVTGSKAIIEALTALADAATP